MKRSKAYQNAAEKVDFDKLYAPLEGIELARETSPTSMDATVEVAMRLGVDPRKADQMVRGTVNLPHGTGKTARVIVFATGDKAREAESAGADVVGGRTTSSSASRAAGSTSTPPSPRPTRWPRSAAWPASSAPAG